MTNELVRSQWMLAFTGVKPSLQSSKPFAYSRASCCIADVLMGSIMHVCRLLRSKLPPIAQMRLSRCCQDCLQFSESLCKH